MRAVTRSSMVVATLALVAGLFGITGTSEAVADPLAAFGSSSAPGSRTPDSGPVRHELVRATPRDKGVLYAAPVRVTLTFGAPIRAQGVSITVRDSTGRSWKVGAPTVTGKKVVQRTNLYAGEGRYEIRYRVYATDGHRITGSIHYRVKSV